MAFDYLGNSGDSDDIDLLNSKNGNHLEQKG